MFCPYCGASNNELSTYCISCGRQLSTPPPSVGGSTQQYGPVPPSQNPDSVSRSDKKKKGIVAIVALVVIALLLVLLATAGNHSSGSNNVFSAPNNHIVSSTYSQSILSGHTTINVKVTNLGNAIGYSTINVDITENSGTYSNTQGVNLAPGETSTFDIVVNTPWGTGVTSSMINVYLT